MMKTRGLTVLAVCVVVFSIACSPASAKHQQPDRSELLQFIGGGHVIGFHSDRVYVATGSHALSVAFAGTTGVTPQSADGPGQAERAGNALPLSRVTYPNLYPGITLTYAQEGGGIMKSTWTIAPSAQPEMIQLKYNVPVRVMPDGSLRLAFETGYLQESAPIAWQEINGTRTPVSVAFVQYGAHEIEFAVSRYDPAYPLFIDPTLTWHTFLGSLGDDKGLAIAVDGSGNVYVAGYSSATWGTPVNAFAGSYDAFAAKLDSSGVRLWHTFLGSSSSDYGRAVAVDGSGNVYVAGESSATWGTPVNVHAGDNDAFAVKLNSSGACLWHTFLGSSSTEYGRAVAVDGSGNVYVAGESHATWGTPVNAFAGGWDAFAAKLSSKGARQWNTFLGSSGIDGGWAMAVDGSGNVYVAGDSDATWGTPVNAHVGLDDAFAAKLSSSGTRQWHTFLGAWGNDYGRAVAVDGSGNVYVAGYSSSTTWGTPVNAFAGSYDAFAAKLSSSGAYLWHTFLGSSNNDSGNAIAVDGSGNVYVAGDSAATWGTPVTAYAGSYDAFAAKLTSSGARLWHTFLGSSNNDYGSGIVVDGSGNVYVAGDSYAPWGTPVNAHTGVRNAFAAKISDSAQQNYLLWTR